MVVVNAKLALYMNTWTLWQAAVFAVTIFAYFIFAILMAMLTGSSSGAFVFPTLALHTRFLVFSIAGRADRSMYYVSLTTMAYPGFWLALLLVLVLCLVPDFAWMATRRFFWPENYQIVQCKLGVACCERLFSDVLALRRSAARREAHRKGHGGPDAHSEESARHPR